MGTTALGEPCADHAECESGVCVDPSFVTGKVCSLPLGAECSEAQELCDYTLEDQQMC